MAKSVEILTDPSMASRGREMVQAMIDACPLKKVVGTQYTGRCEILLTYGTGHLVRRPWWNKHRASGRHCIGLDMGYTAGYMRATVDHDHPQRLVRDEQSDRWDALAIELRDDFDPTGPGIVVGMGQKALRTHALRHLQWEVKAAAKIRAMGLEPVHRPKKQRGPYMPGMKVAHGPIEDVLRGAALVVCRHSNVAVDACIAGIPVICEDGIAHALYSKTSTPSREERLKFLHSMAYWQWKPSEAKDAWNYLLARLG